MSTTITANSDRRLALFGGAAATFAIAGLIAHMADALPTGPATVIVLIGATIGLRVVFSYAAKSASAPKRVRVLKLVSTVGLSVSGVTILGALPHLIKNGGTGRFLADLVAELWSLGVLTVAAGSVRTLGWRTFVGTGMTGFLAITALAGLLGRPVMAALGGSSSSPYAAAFWVSLTEEPCKIVPVLFILAVALHRKAIRPSALDLMLLGAWSGAGFGLYEDAVYGRGSFDLSAAPITSLLVPNVHKIIGVNMVIASHLLWSALIGLGIGLALLYRERWRRPQVVLLVALFTPFLEHFVINAVLDSDSVTALTSLVMTITLHGQLSTVLLIVGIGYALYLEQQALGGALSKPGDWLRLLRPEEWRQLSPTEASRRATLLARAQLTPRLSTSSKPEANV